jgi:Subtilase family/Secretion system C-terminal sorting domain/GEVED domain
MYNWFKIKYISICFLAMPLCLLSQQKTQNTVLQQMAAAYKIKEQHNHEKLVKIAQQKGWELQLKSNNKNQFVLLTSIDSKGFPIYTATDNNTISAATTHTNYLWQNPFNINGSSPNMKGKIAIWDGGAVLNNHIEIGGRIINKDASSNLNHATHVGGTLIAKGINPVTKGMAFGTEQLLSYDFVNHISEITSQANNLLVSNHSYGDVCGWYKTFGGYWIYFGNIGDTADYKFGIYNDEAQMLDSIEFNAPYYLIVKSVGNNRDKNGPAVGQPYKRYDSNGNLVDAGNRPAGIYSNDAYDIIPTYGVAKNILTVGAIEGFTSASTKSADIKMSAMSSWGPTDDGRIKPDLVAAGVNIVSCISDGVDKYDTYTGTSMATPNVTGSLFLLQELYSKKNNSNFMKASTLKALAIHTATETGNAQGPDYQFGWGLLNAEKAANIITATNNNTSKIIETTLNNKDTFKLNVIASGNGKLMATIVWTDIVGQPTTINVLNNAALKLINDLDIRIIKATDTSFPFVLNPAIPNLAATKGDNYRDNVERVEVDNFIPGQAYTIQVTHKRILQRGYQNFSLIISGIGGANYCNPFTNNSGVVRIDSFKIANITSHTANCDSYNNYTHKTALLEPFKTYNATIGISNCMGMNHNKMAKLYIDYNCNGSFNEANELVYTSGVITVPTNVVANFTTPNNIAIGNKTLMRLIVVETNAANSFDACNPAMQNGAIQDYLVQFMNAAKDIAVTEITLPTNNICASNNQYISVSITNMGDSVVENIPLNATIKNGATTVAVVSGIYAPKLLSGETVVYTFQNSFTTIADSTYTIGVFNNLIDDQNSNNNEANNSFKINSKPNTANGFIDICNNVALLKILNADADKNYAWYNSLIANLPIATGENTFTATLLPTYYLATGIETNVGQVDKTLSTSGDYQAKGGNYFYYSSAAPMLLQTAKLYTAYPGKITITVADTIKTYSNGTYDYIALNSTTINVTASKPIQVTGNVNGYDATDTGLIYNINLLLPKGNHILIVTTDSVANIFRNNNIATNPYPYSVANIFNITGNNATNQSGFYYYLYNMKLKTLDCVSDKVAVMPTIAAFPTINKVGDTLISSAGIYYQWQNNGVDIVGEINQKYTPITTGNYSVVVTDFSGCKQSSKVYNAANKNELTIYPNPATSVVNIAFKTNDVAQTNIKIVDIMGNIYIQKNYTSSNTINQKINITSLPNGLYIIYILHGDKTYSKKLIVGR